MKVVVSLILAFALLCPVAPPISAPLRKWKLRCTAIACSTTSTRMKNRYSNDDSDASG